MEEVSTIENNLPDFTPTDFQTAAPYEYINAIHDPFQRRLAVNELNKLAKSYHIIGFMRMLEDYMKSLRMNRETVYVDNVTTFSGQPLELNAGDWEVSESGIMRRTGFGDEVACTHPIIPVERYINVDTGVVKLKIWYRIGKRTHTIIVDKRTIATASSIVQLADCGVSVSSETAKTLVRWLQDVEALNHDLIPEKESVGRLGWIEGEPDEPMRFSPYAGSLEFDGDENFRSFFNAVKPAGTHKEWLAMAREIRKGGITSRVVLAASFASALVRPVGIKPFFVHLWGGAGSGKTVGLMLAASVWANPEMGRYVHTFNSTSVGQEMSAAFCNSLPLIMDELQVVKNKQDYDETIYKLAEGVGRTRSNKNLGMTRSHTWANCIITTGEMPITTGASGGGAIDRVINIECKDELFANPRLVAQWTRKNYGHAGKRFITALQEDGLARVTELHNKFTREIEKSDATPRQSLAAALILTADTLANEYLYNDTQSLTVPDMVEFLATRASVDVGERGYQYMCEWVAQNAQRMTRDSKDGKECWGDIKDGTAYIIRSRYNEAAEEAGYNATALLSWCKQKGLIYTSGKGTSWTRRINGVVAKCIALVLPVGDGTEDLEPVTEEMPF
jgi:hypothetical protein